MTNLLKLAFIGFIFIVSAYGASVLTGNCSSADKHRAVSCALRATEFGDKVKDLDDDNDDQMKEFKRSCDALNDCTRILEHCEVMQYEEAKKGFALINTICTLLEFGTTEFKSCDEKLDKIESNNLFGKDNCFKKAVTDVCGVNEWEKLKERYLSLNDRVKKCNIE